MRAEVHGVDAGVHVVHAVFLVVNADLCVVNADIHALHAVLHVVHTGLRVALQFISRPFVVGDRIEISSVGGSKFVVGVVERVDPMRTIIRTDSCMPITIPNKVGPISIDFAGLCSGISQGDLFSPR